MNSTTRMSLAVRRSAAVLVLLATAGLVACGSPAKRTVVVEDRPLVRTPATAAASSPRPGAMESAGATTSGVASSGESASMAGKPGYYTVKPGDTLVRIGLDHGQNWRDIARWNQIENANLIEVGQVLRVRPEAAASRTAARPVDRSADRPSERSAQAASAPAVAAPRAPAAAAPSAAEAAREPDSAAAEVTWAWPAAGPVLQGFDEQRNKGVDIGGKAGDAVLAAADGRVVYAGSALRGYGNLVILKHNSTFLSAYAHNQTLLVKEDQVVKRGQRIAEMGSTDAERVQLHFEIRRDGKPVDPARYLPSR